MSFVFKYRIETISIDNIDLQNNYFKLSKPLSDDRLKLSIQATGLVDPPLLLKNNKYFSVIFGHNRLQVLKELNIISLTSYIIDELDVTDYINSVLLKNFRNEIGIIGKIKFIWIIKNKFNIDDNKTRIVANSMKIPDEFLRYEMINRILALPEDLKVYIETRDIGFKVVKNILRLPEDAIKFLSQYAINLNMRVNIFKGITENIFDIYKRDKNITEVIKLDIYSNGDKRKKEEILFNEIFKIRYPEYVKIRHKADDIIDRFKRNGIEIDFPEFHEKDEIGVTVKINKRENFELLKDRFEQIDLDSLRDLLNLI